MGLDISAYERVALISAGSYDETLEESDGIYLDNSPEFADRSDGLVRGYYAQSGLEIQFRAGSYSGYNHWRDHLCRAVHGIGARAFWDARAEWDGQPFSELINFTDCDGFLGPKTCDKLARDFAEYEERVIASPAIAGDDWFPVIYRKFREAFELARLSGVVEFH